MKHLLRKSAPQTTNEPVRVVGPLGVRHHLDPLCIKVGVTGAPR